MKKNKLTAKQELFCQEYNKDHNATQAYIRAGFSTKGADRGASLLMKNPLVKAKIKAVKVRAQKIIDVDFEYLTRSYKAIADANIQDFIGIENEIVDISTISRAKASLVKMIKKTVTEFEGGRKTTVQIELHPKMPALEALGRHIGYNEADNNQKKIEINVTRVKP